ncbi:Chitobiosyldiphosphodolichol beta-mannosyltransferase [Aphelenchoides bicaudatus]|nr:Chitobiosyldiphosphodolichol beta-mannosyltransferase [Aphelenchoides bicaudatus]
MSASYEPSGCVKRAIVLVLGDIGHSPRTCHHAYSLASHGVNVELVGYAGSSPHPKISENEFIKVVHLPSAPKWLNNECVPRILQLALKLVFMLVTLLWTLIFCTSFKISILLLQNPPGIPSMLICFLISRLKGASLVVDWHNYSYSMIQQSFSKKQVGSFSKICTDIAYSLEGFSGRLADHNICVSNTMREDLKDRWEIEAITLHDKPPLWNFVKTNCKDRHELFHKLFANFEQYANTLDTLNGPAESTLFTSFNGAKARFKEDRPLLLVSSTSWTEDEDFGILLDALEEYDKHLEANIEGAEKTALPRIFCIITGKGPQKEYYLKQIEQMQMKSVDIVTAWLSAEDYPRLLASADIGVSLHTSTSGYDLPMKVVDMFGCGLPVLAKRFQAIDELVNDPVNGRLFDTSTQLCEALIEIAAGFPNNQTLNELKQQFNSGHRVDWHSQWNAILWPIFDVDLEAHEEEYRRWHRFRMTSED